jgi:chorismate dehydratase
LPALLDSGQVDAILVSSVEYLRRNDLHIISNTCIASRGSVASVRLLSKVPLNEVESLALDESSMTSNLLAQVILAEIGVRPATEVCRPDVQEMLSRHSACVVIGDQGYEADGADLLDVDLGAAWSDLTGQPFVWALWLSKGEASKSSDALGRLLDESYQHSGFQMIHDGKDIKINVGYEYFEEAYRLAEESIQSAVERSGWTAEAVTDYLSNNVRFNYSRAISGLEEFRNRVSRFGLLADASSEELSIS